MGIEKEKSGNERKKEEFLCGEILYEIRIINLFLIVL